MVRHGHFVRRKNIISIGPCAAQPSVITAPDLRVTHGAALVPESIKDAGFAHKISKIRSSFRGIKRFADSEGGFVWVTLICGNVLK